MSQIDLVGWTFSICVSIWIIFELADYILDEILNHLNKKLASARWRYACYKLTLEKLKDD